MSSARIAAGVPRSVRRGVEALADLSDESYEALVAAYDQPAERLGLLVERSSGATGIDREIARSIAVTLTSLRQAYPALSDLDEAARRPLTEEARKNERLVQRTRQLLTSRAVTLLARATRLQLDNARNFSGAFAASALRPLFPNALEDAWVEEGGETDSFEPYGSVILSQLRLDYFEDNDVASFYLSLDRDDLQLLRDVVDRAIKKHSSLADDVENSDRLAMHPLGGE